MSSVKRLAGKLGVMRPVWLIYSSYLRLTRPTGLHVRVLVSRPEDNAVLLIKHTYRSNWFFPGGGIERGETAAESAKREVWEEAGIVSEKPPSLMGVYLRTSDGYFDHIALYKVDHWRREDVTSIEIAAAEFFKMDDLPADTEAGTRRRIEQVAGLRGPDERW